MTTDSPETPNPSEATTSVDRSGFSLLRIMRLVLPVLLVCVFAVLFFGFFDGVGWIQEKMRPPLVHGTGLITFNGKPLAFGEIRTSPTTAGLPGAIGFLDKDGKFVLQTELKGNRVDGAYAGEHRVMVTKYGMAQGPSAPLLVPREVASFASSPLKITVSREPGKNDFVIPIEGEPADQGREADGETAASEQPSGPDPLALTSAVFDNLDQDGDGMLSQTELAPLTEAQRSAITSANRGGNVTKFDLYGVIGRSAELFKDFAASDPK